MRMALRRNWPLAVLTATLGAFALAADEPETKSSAFPRTTIDLGIVVSDIDAARKFYTDALGFTELEGFDVPADFAADTGLSDDQPFHVHVMALGKDETATKLKLMQFKQAPGHRADRAYIHSTYGVGYITIVVDDLKQALARAAKHGVKPIAKGPQKLPEGFPAGLGLANVRDPDGNIIELVGKFE